MEPLRKEAQYAKDVVKEKLTKLFDGIKESIKNRVVKPIGDVVDKHFLTPMKNMLKNLFKGLGGLVGTILSAPFKLVGAAGRSADTKQRNRLKEEYINEKSGKGIKGFFKRLGMQAGWVDREGVQAAMDANGPSYDQRLNEAEEAERIKRENERAAIRNGNKPDGTPSSTGGNTTTKVNTKTNEENTSESNSTSDGTTKVNTTNSDNTDSNTKSSRRGKDRKSKRAKKAERRKAKREKRQAKYNKKDSSTSSSDTKVNTEPNIVDGDYKPVETEEKLEKVVKSNTPDSGDTKVNTKASTSTDGYTPEKSKKEKSSKSKDSNSLLSKIQKDVSKISDSVYGQLNGVGSNVNKIYRLLLKRFGKKDEDIQGDNN